MSHLDVRYRPMSERTWQEAPKIVRELPAPIFRASPATNPSQFLIQQPTGPVVAPPGLLYIVGSHHLGGAPTERFAVDMQLAHAHSPVLKRWTGQIQPHGPYLNAWTVWNAEEITVRLLVRFFYTGAVEWCDDVPLMHATFSRPLADRFDHWIRLWVVADELGCRRLQSHLIFRITEDIKLQEAKMEQWGRKMNPKERDSWTVMGMILTRAAVCASWLIRTALGVELEPFPLYPWAAYREMEKFDKYELLEFLAMYLGMVCRDESQLGIMEHPEMRKFMVY
ncbi:hypothetical protein LZ554_002250 [Drepanopeziza brunnea f. sp. 'monogermtubi']|nr:hypothetical protein LZ554_002250 [Drepanopeziza brunnea f. sp. 'monogermtubi']